MRSSSPLHPRYWGFHALALVLVAAAGWLGAWQLQAWQAGREAEARDLTQEEPRPLADLLGPNDPFPAAIVGAPAEIGGAWLPESTLFISDRRHDEVEGYWVMTPLALRGEDSALLVVRGWVATPEQAPPPPEGEADLTVWLQPGEGTGRVDDDPTDRVLPQVRLADAIQYVDRDLYGGYGVVREPGEGAPADAGLQRASLDQLPPVGGFTSVRNLLYGIEWWIFGCFAAFIWWRWLRDEFATPAEGPDDGSGTEPVGPRAGSGRLVEGR